MKEFYNDIYKSPLLRRLKPNKRQLLDIALLRPPIATTTKHYILHSINNINMFTFIDVSITIHTTSKRLLAALHNATESGAIHSQRDEILMSRCLHHLSAPHCQIATPAHKWGYQAHRES